MNQEEIEKYKQAGQIAQKIRKFARTYIKPGMPIVEIAKTIQDKIEKLGAICAFPVNLSIDDLAAHFHPAPDDETKASGLLKVDIGISVDGYIADTALSLDLTEDNKHKDIIEATDLALKNAIDLLEKDPTLHEIGDTIQKTIESKGFSAVTNLSGHSIERNNIHAGITVPNYGNNNENKLPPGVYAIEPFATTGEGTVYNGDSGHTYDIINQKTPRSPKAREIYNFVLKKYKTLPFSLRELQEKFGPMTKLALKELENQEIIKEYAKLIEKSHHPVTQSEHTIIITDDREIIVTTREE